MQFNVCETIRLIPSKFDRLFSGYYKLGCIVVEGGVETHTYRTYPMRGPVLTQLELQAALDDFKSKFHISSLQMSFEIEEFRAILCTDDYEAFCKPAQGTERIVLNG